MPQETAVDVKEAVAIARAYLLDLFPVYESVELEEVETTSTGGWQVTLSFVRPKHDRLGVSKVIGPQPGERVYKVVSIDASGNPQSVKMR